MLLEFDGVWYVSKTNVTDSLVLANFDKVIEISGSLCRYLKNNEIRYAIDDPLRQWHDVAPLIMKMFTNGKTFDDLPTFTPIVGRRTNTRFFQKENGDMIEYEVPAGEW